MFEYTGKDFIFQKTGHLKTFSQRKDFTMKERLTNIGDVMFKSLMLHTFVLVSHFIKLSFLFADNYKEELPLFFCICSSVSAVKIKVVLNWHSGFSLCLRYPVTNKHL